MTFRQPICGLVTQQNYSLLDPVSEKLLSGLVREQTSTINAVFDVISVYEDFQEVEIVGVGR